VSQHEYAGCGPHDLDESIRQMKADGRKILDFWRNLKGFWIFKLMVAR